MVELFSPGCMALDLIPNTERFKNKNRLAMGD